MLRTRLWMGAVLIALIVAALLLDGGPWFPWLFALVLVLTFAACRELLALLAPKRPQAGWICYVGIAVLLLCNWAPHVLPLISSPYRWDADPWHWLSIAFAGVVLAAFLLEMASFKEPGQSVARIGATVLIVAYLGLLPSFLIQLRWSDIAAGTPDAARSTLALALAIFIPKCCDTGAYFTGRLVGRHGMAPVLSPKKTWEGAIGGLLIATLGALAIAAGRVDLFGGWFAVAGMGLTVGLTGLFGDLAESLIKRDCSKKDASQVVPGFGGVLDVVDSIIFAAPVAYCWLK